MCGAVRCGGGRRAVRRRRAAAAAAAVGEAKERGDKGGGRRRERRGSARVGERGERVADARRLPARAPRVRAATQVPAGGVELVCSNAAPVDATMKEAAGRAHINVVKRKLGILGPNYDDDEDWDFDERGDYDDDDYYDDDEEGEEEQSEDDAAWTETKAPKAFAARLRRMKKEAKEKGRDADFDEWCDLYALVGCAHLRYKATTEDVQKGFKVAQIKYHPDKTMKDAMGSEEDREAAEELFARVQRAYETLTNVKARREFDSIDHFDESVGSNDVDEADFYETFAELFESNGRFSEKKPVPKLGDANTDMKVVDAFYKFWFGMKSWREFKADDEHTINDGDDREHKRHLQRQNAKMREKAKKEERERVMKLVQNAFDCDPRIQARKRAAQEAKDKVKNEKERIRREKEEAEAAAKKAEEDAKAAEEAARKNKAADAKKEKEKRRKEQQKNRKALRAFTGEVAAFDVEGTESLCTGLDFDKLKALVKDLEAAEAAAREELLCTALKELDLEAATRMEERAKRAKELEVSN